VDKIVSRAKRLASTGVKSMWSSQIFGQDALSVLAVVGREVPDVELGTAVIPVHPRHPMVLANQALTVQDACGGRLVLGIGVGGTVRPDQMDIGPAQHNGLAEYAAYGLTAVPPAEGIARLSEAVAILRRMFTEDEFDFDGQYYQLAGTVNSPRPVHPAGPPILVGGSGTRLLRLAAEQADIWNVPGPPHASLEFVAERSRVLDRHCADLGRDPASITRSVQLLITTADPAGVRATVLAATGAGFGHIVLAVRPPWPANLARWRASGIIAPVRDQRYARARDRRSVALAVGHVLLNDVGPRPGPIEEGHFILGDAGSGRVHGRHPALVGGTVGEDQFGDDVEVVRTAGGCLPQEVVAFVRGGGWGQAED